ncbi:MAG: molybdate ABC transporter substrate-binding protein [Planctomycetota bacterium]
MAAVRALVLLAGCAAIPTASCAPGRSAEPLLVFAASSALPAVQAAAERFPSAEVRISAGSTSALGRQILDGAPADLFVSASRDWIDALAARGALLDPPAILCFNRVVCVAARGSRLSAGTARELAAALPEGARIAVGDSGVPVGDEARRLLEASGALPALAGRFVRLPDALAVIRAVSTGNADAAFAFATDAEREGLRILFRLGRAADITYLIAIPRTCRHRDLARRLRRHLLSAPTREELRSMGFGVPPR